MLCCCCALLPFCALEVRGLSHASASHWARGGEGAMHVLPVVLSLYYGIDSINCWGTPDGDIAIVWEGPNIESTRGERL